MCRGTRPDKPLAVFPERVEETERDRERHRKTQRHRETERDMERHGEGRDQIVGSFIGWGPGVEVPRCVFREARDIFDTYVSWVMVPVRFLLPRLRCINSGTSKEALHHSCKLAVSQSYRF